MTIDECARLDAIDHFELTTEEYEAGREAYEGTLYYAKRKLHHSFADLKQAISDAFTGK